MAAALIGTAAAPAVQAHPHMWIDARAVVQFDAQGRVAAVRHEWQFDEMFGAYATQGLPRRQDGSLPPETLRAMADDWIKALGEPISHYFTTVTAGGRRQGFGTPREAAVDWEPKGGRLSLSFVLPLAQPAAPGAQPVSIEVFDPTYFVAYSFKAQGAIAMQGAPQGCRADYREPRELDWQTMQKLALIPADVAEPPEELYAITKGLAHGIEVSCAS